MGFLELCLWGYKIIGCFFLIAIGLLSIVTPLTMSYECNSLTPLLAYIVTIPIGCGCLKLIELLIS